MGSKSKKYLKLKNTKAAAMKKDELKKKMEAALEEYPFETEEEITKKETKKKAYVEAESSEGESTDNENAYYDDIEMDLDLFVNNKLIVENSPISLIRNKKYGLVGRNGIGKTTLLKAIRKRQFGIPKALKIHLLKQDYVSDEKIIDYVGIDGGKILQNLGFKKEQLQQTLREMSGGWRMRAQLAKAIHLNPDLLLLDEPTNFLDIHAINFLESQIENLKTVIIVSHDRNFLNNTTDTTLLLHNYKIETYNGNYSAFVKQKEEERIRAVREYDSIKAQRDHMESFINRFRANAKRSSQAQSRIKLMEKIPLPELAKEAPQMKFRIKTQAVKGVLVEIENTVFSYPIPSKDGETINKKVIFKDLSLRIDTGSRMVIVGENGMGKSTLLRLLTQNIFPDSGKVTLHPALKIGYFAQHHLDHLDHEQGALSLLMKTYDEETSRAALSNFGLQINNQKIGTLSGGQKSRLAFALLSLEKPNMLIMDEPTNHLDMETIDALADALINFEGAVICVSHDLAFIQKVFNEVYICENQELTFFRGSPLDYKESIKEH
ncbi:uncharacterized protein LOC143922181 [Arctopsyche grandis]|uniref:uncharacterized protein LOC143922181 n=1 Tax=Arctopsyche grandis TaxID=121162 RepID=UPI00406D79BC